MKVSKNIILSTLIILLIATTIVVLRTSSNHNRLQKEIDFMFTSSITDSLDGLSKDYDKLDRKAQIRYYYKVLDNLKDALDIFHLTTYKNNDQLFNTIHRIYTYVLVNQDGDYPINNQMKLYEILSKMIVYPEDYQLLEEFIQLLDEMQL